MHDKHDKLVEVADTQSQISNEYTSDPDNSFHGA